MRRSSSFVKIMIICSSFLVSNVTDNIMNRHVREIPQSHSCAAQETVHTFP